MRKLKAIFSGMLAAATILSLTGCDEGGVASNSGAGAGPGVTSNVAPQTSVTTTTFAENSAVNDAVNEMDLDALDNPDLEVTDRIEWMAWWDIDETSPAAILFKNTYGVPTTGKDPERDGRIFDYTVVSYGERYDKLATAISSGDSPDFFPFEILDFPYGVLKGRYQPIDEVVNLDNGKWEGAKDMMEQFKLGGRYYAAFYEISLNNLMYYRTSIIDGAGLDDPRTLFENGQWTWDTFLDMARAFQNSGENKYVIDGSYTASGVANKLSPIYHEIAGMTWGIIGYGNIGRAVGAVAEALGARVIVNKRTPIEGATRVGIEQLCRESDIITIHCPLNANTREMINSRTISLMKKSVIIVNEARGAVVNESDIADAVEQGRIGGFGSDVYTVEPIPAEHPYTRIMHRENVLLTPHAAWGSLEARIRCVNVVSENITAFINGKTKNRVDI